jgi:hypothetical protein
MGNKVRDMDVEVKLLPVIVMPIFMGERRQYTMLSSVEW